MELENEGGNLTESMREEALDKYLDSSEINVASSLVVKPNVLRTINFTTNSNVPLSTADLSEKQSR